MLMRSRQKPRFSPVAKERCPTKLPKVDFNAQLAKTTLFAGGKETMSDEIAKGNFVQ
jgi:hypothetical protein